VRARRSQRTHSVRTAPAGIRSPIARRSVMRGRRPAFASMPAVRCSKLHREAPSSACPQQEHARTASPRDTHNVLKTWACDQRFSVTPRFCYILRGLRTEPWGGQRRTYQKSWPACSRLAQRSPMRAHSAAVILDTLGLSFRCWSRSERMKAITRPLTSTRGPALSGQD